MCALTQSRVVDECWNSSSRKVNCLQSQEFYQTGVQVRHAACSRQLWGGVRERVHERVDVGRRVRESDSEWANERSLLVSEEREESWEQSASEIGEEVLRSGRLWWTCAAWRTRRRRWTACGRAARSRPRSAAACGSGRAAACSPPPAAPQATRCTAAAPPPPPPACAAHEVHSSKQHSIASRNSILLLLDGRVYVTNNDSATRYRLASSLAQCTCEKNKAISERGGSLSAIRWLTRTMSLLGLCAL